MQNPYITGNPVFNRDGKQVFFGRQDIIEQIQSELHNRATNALVLFGQRCIGKTSLLRQLEHTLPADAFFPVYFNLQDQGRELLGNVLGNLADRMVHLLDLPYPEEQFDNEGRVFRQVFMPRVYEHLGNKQRLVLLFDEFDVLDRTVEQELDENAATQTLFPFLYNLMKEEMQVAVILVLGRRLEELSTPGDFQQTLKASLCQEIWLLNKEETGALIRQAEADNSLRFTPAAIARIYSLTAGHPYLTQMLCHCIWHQAHAGAPSEPPLIDGDEVEAAIADTLTAADAGLGWLWDGLPPEAQLYAAALAQVDIPEGETISHDHVIQVLQEHAARLRTSQVEQSPRQLVKWRILEEKGQAKTGEPGYRYAVELMRRWVKERHTARQEQKIREQQQAARQASAQKNWAEVGRLYTQLINQYPSDERQPEWQAGLAESSQQTNMAQILEDDGRKLLESGDWENAVNSYQALLQRYPMHENRTIWENNLLQAGHGRDKAKQFNQAQEALNQGDPVKAQNLLQDLVAEHPDWQQDGAPAAHLLDIAKYQIQIRREYENRALWSEAIKACEQHLTGASQAYEKSIWQREIERCRHEATLYSRFREGEAYLQAEQWRLAAQSFGVVIGEHPDYTLNGQSARQLRDLAVLHDLGRPIELPTQHLTVPRLILIILLTVALTTLIYSRTVQTVQPEIVTTIVQETVAVEIILEVTRQIPIEQTVVVEQTVPIIIPPAPTPTAPILAQPPTPASPIAVSDLSLESVTQVQPFQLSGVGKLAGVAYYPNDGDDHRIFALAASTGIYIYDVNGNRVHFQQSNVPVTAVAFSKDSLASAYNDGTIKLWRIHGDGTLSPADLDHVNERINRISLSPDGRLLAAVSEEGNIQLWRVNNAQLTLEPPLTSQENAPINDVIFASTNNDPNEYWLAIAANSGAQLWWININNHSKVHISLADAQANARSVTFSNDGRFLIVGTAGGTVQIWEPGKSERPHNFAVGGENAGTVNAVVYSPTADLLVTASNNNRRIFLWQLDENGQGQLDRILPGHQAAVQSMAFAPDGKTLISISPDDVALWSIQPSNLNLLGDDYGHHGAVTDLVFASDESFFVSAAADNTLMLWCPRDGKPLLANPITIREGVVTSLAIKLLGGSDVLAAGTDTPSIQLWRILPGEVNDPPSSCEPRQLEPLTTLPIEPRFSLLASNAVNDVAFSSDGQILAAALANGWVKDWTITINEQQAPQFTGREEFIVTTINGGVGRIVFSPANSGMILATSSGNGKITLYPSEASASIRGIKPQLADIEAYDTLPVSFNSLFFAPDGNTLFASARGFPIQSFSITATENENERQLIPNPISINAENVVSMALMPNPALLASISDDGEARVWQWPDGQSNPIAKFNQEITSLAVSGFVDSSPLIIALGLSDGTISLYGVTEQPGQ